MASVTDRRTYLLAGTITRSPTVEETVRRTDTTLVEFGGTADLRPLDASVALAAGVVYDVSARAAVLLHVQNESGNDSPRKPSAPRPRSKPSPRRTATSSPPRT